MKTIKKTIPLTITSNRTKCLGINLTKLMQNLYSGTYKKKVKVVLHGKIFTKIEPKKVF